MLAKTLNKLLFTYFVGILAAENSNKELALNHFMQGEFLMNQGNYALAILEFQDAIDLDPNASTIHVSLADGYRRIGKLSKAENHLGIALELDSEEEEALEMLGQIFLTQKRYQEAKKTYQDLSDLNPNNVDYIYTLADLARIDRDWDLAIDYYVQGYEINSLAIAGLEKALQIALTISSFNRAQEICSLLLQENPTNIDLLETLKDLTLFNGNYEESLKMLKKIEEINGESIETLIQKSALYEELNEPELALEMIYNALEDDSVNIDVLHRLVTLLMSQDKNEDAILYNQKIIEHHPNDSRGFINTAVMAMSGKKPEEAISALSPHSEKFSEDFTIQYLLGTAYYQIKDYEKSKIYLSNALKIYPQSRNTKHNLALIYDSTGDWEESDKLYVDLIASDTTDAQAYNNYAYSLVERDKDIDFALELAQNAIKIEPKSAAYLDTIGWIYFKMNMFDEALLYIRESLSIDSNNPTIQGHLDMIIKNKTKFNSSKIEKAEN